MNDGIDPRLQQPFYNAGEYPFPHHSGFDAQLQQYAYNPQLNGALGGAPASALRNNNVRATRNAALAEIQRQDNPQQNVAGAQVQNAPQRKNTSTPKQGNGLVFKNSSSTFPSGGRALSDDAELASYVPLATLQQSNINEPNNYFADALPTRRTPVPDPPPAPASSEPNSGANPFDTSVSLVPFPANLEEWRKRLFNIVQPLHMSESEFLTYFPHVDNIYSHRSTQKYKRKPFVSHYWDCRLKGRPSGTKKSDDPNKKKRKREKRERDLCDVKIKITEWFSREECEAQSLSHPSDGGEIPDMDVSENRDGLQIVMDNNMADPDNAFSILEPSKRLPSGHPGANGKKWYTVQRVNNVPDGAETNADDGHPLDHKHTLDDSDKIKKNSVQRWQLQLEKEKRLSLKTTQVRRPNDPSAAAAQRNYASLPYLASGLAARTSSMHRAPVASHLTFYANSYCPFAQRVWIALEIKEIPYQYVEIVPSHVLSPASGASNNSLVGRPKELLEVNPEGIVPAIKHGNWGIWESGIMLEYLEDLEGYLPLLPTGLGSAQLRAHCRLWVDHLNRKILPAFYAVLLTPPPRSPGGSRQVPGNMTVAANDEEHGILISTLQRQITALVNASHAIGPFFLGESISYVDVAFAPWIIRLSRVLSHYRNFPRPEVGTRWQRWVDAIETDERVRRTISTEDSYHNVYKGVGEDGWDGRTNDAGWHASAATNNHVVAGDLAARITGKAGLNGSVKERLRAAESGQYGTEAQELHNMSKKVMVEAAYARKVLREEGFGLGGDDWGKLGLDGEPEDGMARL